MIVGVGVCVVCVNVDSVVIRLFDGVICMI